MKKFELSITGDPFNPDGWDVREYENDFDDRFCIFRGDLSPIQGLDNAIYQLNKLYPGCEIRVEQ